MKTSAAGLAFIERWEGPRLTAYKDSGGVWTIGVGHTGPEVVNGLTITAAKATDLLAEDVIEAEVAVRQVTVPLTQAQFDTLVSFAFNVGNTAFASSTLLRKLNAGDYAAVPAQLGRWVHDNGKVVAGLVNRRKAEGEMWALGTTVVENVHPPEQTSTIPSPADDSKPNTYSGTQTYTAGTPGVGQSPEQPAPWYIALIRAIAALFGRKS